MDNILKQKATHHHHITIIFSQLYQAKQSKLISPSSRVTSTVLFSSPKAPTVSLNYSLSFHWLPGWLTLFFHSSWAENIYCNEWVKVPSAVLVANSKQPVLWCLTERTGLTSQLVQHKISLLHIICILVSPFYFLNVTSSILLFVLQS